MRALILRRAGDEAGRGDEQHRRRGPHEQRVVGAGVARLAARAGEQPADLIIEHFEFVPQRRFEIEAFFDRQDVPACLGHDAHQLFSAALSTR
jgi:hypothetical protein